MHSVVLVLGVQYSDFTLPYNTQSSSQQVHSLIPNTNFSQLPHPPPLW